MIEQLLKDALDNNVSDIHITSDDFIAFRTRKKIRKLDVSTSKEEVTELAKKLAGDLYDTFLENRQMDLSGEINGVRYRANIYFERGSIAIAIRVINNKIKSIIELNLPHILFELIKKPNGLILVTGPTGCGKSTSLAAMINEINKDFSKHIITLEDPIEYIFENKKSIIHQRELGPDFHSFSEGLHSILRQDPDIIMVGELRDKITIQTALKASETGHLVMSTLHTSSVKSSINRITGVFNAEEAEQIRYLLADSLIAILTQKLIRTADNKGVIPAFEILINTTATSNLIRKGEVGQLDSYLMMDQRKGSIPMEKSIEKLLHRGLINQDDLD
jgi:twitching motility protein PilT